MNNDLQRALMHLQVALHLPSPVSPVGLIQHGWTNVRMGAHVYMMSQREA